MVERRKEKMKRGKILQFLFDVPVLRDQKESSSYFPHRCKIFQGLKNFSEVLANLYFHRLFEPHTYYNNEYNQFDNLKLSVQILTSYLLVLGMCSHDTDVVGAQKFARK